MPQFGSLGMGMDPGAMEAVQEALSRRGVGGDALPVLGQSSTETIGTPNPEPNMSTGAAPAMSAPRARGGGPDEPETKIILKALINRLNSISQTEKSSVAPPVNEFGM